MAIGMAIVMAGALPAAAQNAMRAPLNIVPPVMQQAIGQPKAERRNDKLAPRVAARQSKRAVGCRGCPRHAVTRRATTRD